MWFLFLGVQSSGTVAQQGEACSIETGQAHPTPACRAYEQAAAFSQRVLAGTLCNPSTQEAETGGRP